MVCNALCAHERKATLSFCYFVVRTLFVYYVVVSCSDSCIHLFFMFCSAVTARPLPSSSNSSRYVVHSDSVQYACDRNCHNKHVCVHILYALGKNRSLNLIHMLS